MSQHKCRARITDNHVCNRNAVPNEEFCCIHVHDDARILQGLQKYLPNDIMYEMKPYLQPSCLSQLFDLKHYTNDIGGIPMLWYMNVWSSERRPTPPIEFTEGTCMFETIYNWVNDKNYEGVHITIDIVTNIVNWSRVKKTRPPFLFSDPARLYDLREYDASYEPYYASVHDYINRYYNADAKRYSLEAKHSIYYTEQGPYIGFTVTLKCGKQNGHHDVVLSNHAEKWHSECERIGIV
jgi:hypothetical protein